MSPSAHAGDRPGSPGRPTSSGRPTSAGRRETGDHLSHSSYHQPLFDRTKAIYSEPPVVIQKQDSSRCLPDELPIYTGDAYVPQLQVERTRALPPVLSKAVETLVPEHRRLGPKPQVRKPRKRTGEGSDDEAHEGKGKREKAKDKGSYVFKTQTRLQANRVGYICQPVNEITAPGLYNVKYHGVEKRVTGPSFTQPVYNPKPAGAAEALPETASYRPTTARPGTSGSDARRTTFSDAGRPGSSYAHGGVTARVSPSLAESGADNDDLERFGVVPNRVHPRKKVRPGSAAFKSTEREVNSRFFLARPASAVDVCHYREDYDKMVKPTALGAPHFQRQLPRPAPTGKTTGVGPGTYLRGINMPTNLTGSNVLAGHDVPCIKFDKSPSLPRRPGSGVRATAPKHTPQPDSAKPLQEDPAVMLLDVILAQADLGIANPLGQAPAYVETVRAASASALRPPSAARPVSAKLVTVSGGGARPVSSTRPFSAAQLPGGATAAAPAAEGPASARPRSGVPARPRSAALARPLSATGVAQPAVLAFAEASAAAAAAAGFADADTPAPPLAVVPEASGSEMSDDDAFVVEDNEEVSPLEAAAASVREEEGRVVAEYLQTYAMSSYGRPASAPVVPPPKQPYPLTYISHDRWQSLSSSGLKATVQGGGFSRITRQQDCRRIRAMAENDVLAPPGSLVHPILDPPSELPPPEHDPNFGVQSCIPRAPQWAMPVNKVDVSKQLRILTARPPSTSRHQRP